MFTSFKYSPTNEANRKNSSCEEGDGSQSERKGDYRQRDAVQPEGWLRRPGHLLEIPPKAIIQAISFCVTIGWALYSARLLSLSGKGALESSWKNLAIGAILTAIGILFLTIADLVETSAMDIIGSAIVALGGVFMLLAIRRQYSVWKAAFSSANSKKPLKKFDGARAGRTLLTDSPTPGPSPGAIRGRETRIGSRTILEFDPTSDYEEYVASRVKEALSGGSTPILFTKPGTTLSTLEGVKIVLLSFADKNVKLSPEGHMSVSIANQSLILDAFSSIVKLNPGAPVTIDSLTDLVLSLGFAKAYNLLWQMSEIIAESKSNLLLLFNPRAHDEKISTMFEGYADAILSYDRTGLHSKKGDIKDRSGE
jgi:hypothetical protein